MSHVVRIVDDLTPLGMLAIEEVKRFSRGARPLHPVTLKMLSHTG